MSGSNSSDRDALPEALSFSVHGLPQVDAAAVQRQTRRGRLKMLLVLAVCAAPVVASYLTYYVVRPDGRSNYGQLIEPPRPVPALVLARSDGTPVAPTALKGQWLLVNVAAADCAEPCRKRLFMQRQLREMLGRERTRLDKVWFVTGNAPLPADLRQPPMPDPASLVLRADRQALAAWLQPAPGQELEDHLYLVDPRGEWMMRFPAEPDPARIKRDLDRLLRAAASWDREGR